MLEYRRKDAAEHHLWVGSFRYATASAAKSMANHLNAQSLMYTYRAVQVETTAAVKRKVLK